jgi:hypothetical protein
MTLIHDPFSSLPHQLTDVSRRCRPALSVIRIAVSYPTSTLPIATHPASRAAGSKKVPKAHPTITIRSTCLGQHRCGKSLIAFIALAEIRVATIGLAGGDGRTTISVQATAIAEATALACRVESGTAVPVLGDGKCVMDPLSPRDGRAGVIPVRRG